MKHTSLAPVSFIFYADTLITVENGATTVMFIVSTARTERWT